MFFLGFSLTETQRRKSKELIIALVILLTLIFIGCQLDDDDEIINVGFIPVGEWSFGEAPFIEGYKITNTGIEYYSPDYGSDFPAQNFKGSIEEVIDFPNKAGVLIIKITSVENIILTPGKYTCVYYRDYTVSHVYLANPMDALFNPIEADTLEMAKKIFTVDNVDTHVTFWGTGYSK
jgi:hypothetical protein